MSLSNVTNYGIILFCFVWVFFVVVVVVVVVVCSSFVCLVVRLFVSADSVYYQKTKENKVNDVDR